jgi:hypothetical protein
MAALGIEGEEKRLIRRLRPKVASRLRAPVVLPDYAI